MKKALIASIIFFLTFGPGLTAYATTVYDLPPELLPKGAINESQLNAQPPGTYTTCYGYSDQQGKLIPVCSSSTKTTPAAQPATQRGNTNTAGAAAVTPTRTAPAPPASTAVNTGTAETTQLQNVFSESNCSGSAISYTGGFGDYLSCTVTQPNGTYVESCPNWQNFQSGVGSGNCNITLNGSAIQNATSLASASVTDVADAVSGSCNILLDLWGCLTNFVAWVLTWIVNVVYWTVFWVVWLSAELLDFCVQQFVLNMGTYINAAGAQGVQTAWGIIRDLANIGIVGGMIAIAISTILQIQAYSANKFLARLIIMAILVNFSYFFAGSIIDVSNYLATIAYNQATSGVSGCGIGECTLTFRFMEATNFQSIHDNLTSETAKQSLVANVSNAAQVAFPSNPWQTLWIDILSVVFELIAIFVFLSAAALLLGRFVALIFLLISSPIGIAGFGIPGIAKYAKQWWGILFAQAFFAPVYFLLLSFSFLILQSSKAQILNAAASFGSQAIGTMLTFLVASAFMLISLKAAKQMSESGKEYLGGIYKGADKIAGWLPKYYQKGVKFGGAVVARNILGGVAEWGEHRYRKLAARLRLGQQGPLVAAADRWFQEALEKTARHKFFGYSAFKTEKEARRAREQVLGEVGKDELQRGKLQGWLVGQEKGDYKNLRRRLSKKELEEYDRLQAAEEAGKASDAEKARLKGLREKMSPAERERLKEYERRQHKWGKKGERGALGIMNTAEKAFEKEYSAGAEKKRDEKTGKLETEEQYSDRQKGRGEWGRQRVRNEKGEWEWEDLWGYHERLDKLKIGEGGLDISYRDARASAEAIYGNVSDKFFEREYDQKPESIAKLAKLLKPEQWKRVVEDAKIRRDVRNDMWTARRGEYARIIQSVQDRVDRGELVEGSKEYFEALLVPYNYAAKNIRHEEFANMILSDAQFDSENHPGKRFEDLRKTGALWVGSLSTSFKHVKDNNILPETEMRNAGVLKRKPMDDIRDEQAGAYRILGYGRDADNNRDYVPYEDGTANYHAEERATLWAKDRERMMTKVIANYNSGPDRGGVSKEDYKTAQKELRYAQMVNAGPSKNPLQARIAQQQAAVTSQEVAQYARKNNVAESQARKELREDKKAAVISEARARYEERMRQIDAMPVTTQKEIDARDQEREKFLKDDTNFVMDRLVETEKRAEGWYAGKNPDEVSAILNKRSYWSTATAYGINANQLKSIEGQDIGERKAFFENLLMRGDDSLIANYAGNDNLKDMFSWPSKERMRQINRVRVAQGKKALPETFEEQAVARVFRGE